ncbi:MAG: hypothetical protein H7Y19_08065 [Luteimonas sp.]|nr:hypothetical protein [Luteimonas sp.]
MDWLSLKNEAARMLIEKDALHIYAALLIQVVAAKLSRRSLGHALPWLWVLALELINELLDLRRGMEPVVRPWQVVSGVHDIINTLLLPSVLLLLVRYAGELFRWGPLDSPVEPGPNV